MMQYEDEFIEEPCKKYDPIKQRVPYRKQVEDNINPRHYTEMVISPHEYNKLNNMPWNEAQVIKYVSRWKKKNGLEDLKKASWYLNDLIQDIESKS